MAGKHRKHLKSDVINKGIALTTKASEKVLKKLADAQGNVTKKEAKHAKKKS